MTETKTYKGLDVLEKILEFTAMTPDTNQWNLSALKGNPPRHVRLRQIQSLTKAFFEEETKPNLLDKTKAFFQDDLTTLPITSILKGTFITNRPIEAYSELMALMKDTVSQNEGELQEERPMHVVALVLPYQRLVQYKRRMIELLSFNSGWIEATSFASRFSIYLTDAISANLEGKHSALDTALELFINPKGLTFTEQEFVSNYKFPTENLSEIDMNYM